MIEVNRMGHFPEVIKLQLKKPKTWNWQLSTSKSSPHITLPIIQLYDSKGQLVVETKDDGRKRSSWHSEKRYIVHNKLAKCSSEVLDSSISGKRVDVGRQNRQLRDVNDNSIRESDGSFPELKKSKSYVLEIKGKLDEDSTSHPLRTIRSSCDFSKSSKKPHYHQAKSDDMFCRKLKYNSESSESPQSDAPTIVKHSHVLENVLLPNNCSNIKINDVKYNRYKTRTSSAGTLIIRDETFNNCHRRRRRRDASIENLNNAQQNNANLHLRNTIGNREIGGLHAKHVSDPANVRDKILNIGDPQLKPNKKLANRSKRDKLTGQKTHHKNNFNYGVRDSDDNEESIRKKLEKKKRQHVQKRSIPPEKQHQNKSKGNRTKARVIKDPKESIGSGDSDLLQLVRRLSSCENVKMGANVSRHSSKGLSGRRSQSSGSICNGKGRHSDGGGDGGSGKMCGSLPSYLDDRNSTGCNNNHDDCEKPPLDGVQRIPPLGDGAPLHWKFSDNHTVLCDQGYGSERSPEEEYPPPLPDHDSQCHHHLEPHACYPFITPESTFIVKLTKSSRGLGLSVTGGIDSGGSWPGLIRIKRLFPHQPASVCGLLNVGDLIIEANGITLTGLTNYEALEVLRTAPNQVDLKVCRPPPDVLSCVSPISEVPPPPPRREPPTSLNFSAVYGSPDDEYYHGEFEVTLTKIQGSLGFTLRKEDDSALGHYVRALVREPALTDGRIRAGDKIIAVNEVEISSMSHEQAVQFLRQCGDVVKLRLYRDSAQTPVAALSPTETTPRTSFSKKIHLRQEAVDMLNDIAVRKLIPPGQGTFHTGNSPNSSPRRLRRQTCPSDASHDSSLKYMINDEQFHEGLLQQCSHFDADDLSLFTLDDPEDDRPSRPSSLDLYNPNQTPIAARKPRFNFSLAHNAYELNNLDPEVLDAPNLTYTLGNDEVMSTEVECGDSFSKEPASMPQIHNGNEGFSYKNPAYQSAHPQMAVEADVGQKKVKSDDIVLKKWKGSVFEYDDKDECLVIEDEYNIHAIELNRGWNSRLGFSLQGAAGVTYVSAVHADSVAAKDGRLKPGDRIIKVNDECVEHLTTNEIIDLLRIVRGPVCIVVSRIKSKEDCLKSNAEN